MINFLRYNWFRKIGGRKKRTPFWRGRYRCAEALCTVVFEAHVKDCCVDTSMEMFITVVGSTAHGTLKPKTRITGNDRKLIGTQLMAYGINNFETNQNLGKNILNSGIRTNA